MEHGGLTPGARVWVAAADGHECWMQAVVAEPPSGDKVLVVLAQKEKRSVATKECFLVESLPGGGVEDMTRLSYLHEPGVLHNLTSRYSLDEIYTYTGSILIAVNPFRRLPHLYSPHMMEQYKGMPLGELSPHVFAIADAAYRTMVEEGTSQSILVSGESGAGKTETTKLIMQYFAYLGGRVTTGGGDGTGTRHVEQQVLESNPLLEAFGNAKTVRNDNSSRFGKFAQVQFDAAGRISGAAIRTYLLERSRVTSVSPPERNYHVFYQLVAGAHAEERADLDLGPGGELAGRHFHYLSQSGCFDLEGVSNAEEYGRTRRAMTVVGLSEMEQAAVMRVVASVLHLGNVGFELDDAARAGGGDAAARVSPAGEPHLASAARLLQADHAGLRKALLTRGIATPEGVIVVPLAPPAAAASRDSLARTLYLRLFDWLVERINASIGQDAAAKASIGLLDIYGFESFTTNSFEQFCINLANEKLQQHFNGHVFKEEQAEYAREAIDWSYVDFVDNQDALDLLEGRKPAGIIALLDEQCLMPKATPATFAERLGQSFGGAAPHGRFRRPKATSVPQFAVSHYAGEVIYAAEAFLEKNKDYVVGEHQAVMTASACAVVRALFKESAEDAAARAKASMRFSSVAGRFRSQLGELMKTLQATAPHYVRCIKPNALTKPAVVDPRSVMHQLRCGGVLEAVRISLAGYPARRRYDEFLDRYGPLAPALVWGGGGRGLGDKEVTRRLLASAGVTGWQLGHTKVFLRAGHLAVLDAARSATLYKAAVVIQRHGRGLVARRRLAAARTAAVTIQAAARGLLARRLRSRLIAHRAAVRIQVAWKGGVARATLAASRRAVVVIQSAWRGHSTRKKLFAERRAAAAAAAAALRRSRAATSLQCAWRGKLARREARSRRAAARETGALLSAKSALEKRLEDVGTRWALEKRLRAAEGEAAVREAAAAATALAAAKAAAATALESAAKWRAEAVMERDGRLAAIASAAKAESAATAAAESAAADHAAAVAAEAARARAEGESATRDAAISQSEAAARDASAAAAALRLQLASAEERAAVAEGGLVRTAERLAAAEERAASAEAAAMALAVKCGCASVREALNLPPGVWAAATAAGAGVAPPSTPAASAAMGGSKPGTVGGSVGATPPSTLGAPTTTVSVRTPLAEANKAGTGVANGHGGPGMLEGIAAAVSTSLVTLSGGGVVSTKADGGVRAAGGGAAVADTEALLAYLGSEVGFDRSGRPIGPCIAYRALLHWRAFEAERTNLFQAIIKAINGAIEKQPESTPHLAYWLTATATLLLLMQRTLRTGGAGAGGGAAKKKSQHSLINRAAGWFGMATAGSPTGGESSSRDAELLAMEGGHHTGGGGGHAAGVPTTKVEAKYPALLFKQQITAFVEKVYGILRDNVKKEIAPLFPQCIQAPRPQRTTSGGVRSTPLGGGAPGSAGGATLPRGQLPLGSAWGAIIEVLDRLYDGLKDAHVPDFLRRKLFTQLFAFINSNLFNSLLLRRECCSFSNGEYVKSGVAELETWLVNTGDHLVGSAFEELRYIRQAVGFLVIHQKPKKSLEEITQDLCPALTVQQLYRISTLYWDDKYSTETVAPDVLDKMKRQLHDEQIADGSNSFLLDDDSSIPFSLDEIALAYTEFEVASLSSMPPPLALQGLPGFDFLSEPGSEAATPAAGHRPTTAISPVPYR